MRRHDWHRLQKVGLSMIRAAAIALFLSAPALAEEPSVTLTQPELQALVAAETAKALANYNAQLAQAVYDKVKKAFAPGVPPPSPLSMSQRHGGPH
jgi:hypothetical protein